MLRWIFAMFLIAIPSCMIWWPGHFSDEHFALLGQEELNRAVHMLPEYAHALSEKLRAFISEFWGKDIFPNAGNRRDVEIKDSFERMARVPYWQSFKSMTASALIRFTVAVSWFVLLLPLALITLVDALMVRKLRYESFACTHPTLYRAALLAPGFLLGFALLAMLCPLPIPLYVPILFYIAFLVSLHTLAAHFHRF